MSDEKVIYKFENKIFLLLEKDFSETFSDFWQIITNNLNTNDFIRKVCKFRKNHIVQPWEKNIFFSEFCQISGKHRESKLVT